MVKPRLTGCQVRGAVLAGVDGGACRNYDRNSDVAEVATSKEAEMALSVSSSVFGEGDMIPARYTCQGEDVSPPVAWSGVPAGTRSLVLIMDDPDAPVGVFSHWVIFNIAVDSPGLPEAVPAQAQLPGGALQGRNDFGRVGYGGPCPPPGRPHRYQFTVYALDSSLELEAGASKGQVLGAVRGHILAQGRLSGRYQR
jgi:Raf kinase inhibitor-like YbhB/YbcL family protein